jgi:hypothetical protein
MKDTTSYLLKLSGQVSESEMNALSPLQMTVEACEGDETLLTVCTDQSGLIGLMRHLHGLGFVLVAMSRLDQE